VELDARNLEGGEETEEDSGENGNQRSETDDREIHVYVGEARDADGGQVRENACTEKSEEQAERGTAAGKNNAFGKHLANETGLSSSERGANGDFFLACSRAREEQVGKIGADDEHDGADGTGEDYECGAKTSADMGGERSECGV